jgi:hypothetical protein
MLEKRHKLEAKNWNGKRAGLAIVLDSLYLKAWWCIRLDFVFFYGKRGVGLITVFDSLYLNTWWCIRLDFVFF